MINVFKVPELQLFSLSDQFNGSATFLSEPNCEKTPGDAERTITVTLTESLMVISPVLQSLLPRLFNIW